MLRNAIRMSRGVLPKGRQPVRTFRAPRRTLSVHVPTQTNQKTIKTITQKFENKEKITMVTAYDYTAARLVNFSDMDMVLVGDSLGMTVQGNTDTRAVTVDEIIYHCKAVKKGASSKFVVGDMPFGSYEGSDEDAVHNALRIMKEGGVDAVKLEGGERMASRIRAIANAGIPVMGHIGLTPQSASSLGGFKVQGQTAEGMLQLETDSLAVAKAGAFAMVFEGIPQKVAARLTETCPVPTIGIGAGAGTSGQVLVLNDLLGLNEEYQPKFSKQYAKLEEIIVGALERYTSEVKEGSFPAAEHSYKVKLAEFHKAFPDTQPVENRYAIPTQSDVVILGGGAVGSMVAGHLSQSHQVAMITNWNEHGKAVNERGLLCFRQGGETVSTKAENLSAPRTPEEVADKVSRAKLLIVAVKSNQTAAALEAVKDSLPSDCIVVTLQNGLGNAEVIKKTLGIEPVIGVSTIGARVLAPGQVVFTDGALQITEPSPGRQRQVGPLVALFNMCGLQAELIPSSQRESLVWGKLLINAAINPITAVARCPNGDLLLPQYRGMLKQTVNEVEEVAKARGVVLPYEDPLAKVLDVARQTATNHSSMLQDVLRGVDTEIDAINGKVIEAARQLWGEMCHSALPLNHHLVDLIKTKKPYHKP